MIVYSDHAEERGDLRDIDIEAARAPLRRALAKIPEDFRKVTVVQDGAKFVCCRTGDDWFVITVMLKHFSPTESRPKIAWSDTDGHKAHMRRRRRKARAERSERGSFMDHMGYNNRGEGR